MNRCEYQSFLKDIKLTEEQVQAVMAAGGPILGVEIPSVKLKCSGVHGLGVFADKGFKAGEEVGTARLGGLRTILGRFANHSNNPNVEFKLMPNGDLHSMATRYIIKGDELFNDYRQGAILAGAYSPN